MDHIKAHNNKIQLRFKEQAVINYTLARQIGEHVAALFDSKNTISPIWEHYPELFEDEKVNHEKIIEQKAIEAWKAQFESFAKIKNKSKEVNK